MNKQNDQMRQHLANMYKNTKAVYGVGFGGDPRGGVKKTGRNINKNTNKKKK